MCICSKRIGKKYNIQAIKSEKVHIGRQGEGKVGHINEREKNKRTDSKYYA